MKKIISMILIGVVIIINNVTIVRAEEIVNKVSKTSFEEKACENFKYLEYEDGILLSEYTGNSNTVDIPTMINNKNVYIVGKDDSFNKIKKAIIKNNPSKKIYTNIYGLKNVEEITFEDGIEEIGEGAIKRLDSLKKVVLPSTITKILSKNFFECNNLLDINLDVLHDVSIEEFCFQETKLLNERGMIIIDNQLIKVDTKLTDIVIPEGVEEINKFAFGDYKFVTGNYYSNIKSIKFPSTLKTIKTNAMALVIMPVVKIPDGVVVEKDAFNCLTCVKKENDSISDDEQKFLFDRNSGTIYKYYGDEKEVKIPSSIDGIQVKKICGDIMLNNYRNASIFEENNNVEKITIPEGVEEINGYCFNYLMNLYEINIPESVKVISCYAFEGCEKLNKLIIPNENVKIVDFYDNEVNELEDIESVKIGYDKVTVENFIYEKETGLIRGYTGNEEVVSIPSEIDGTKIIGISCEEMFKNSIQTKKVILPEGIQVLKDKVFYNCSNITDIELPSSLKNIGKDVFEGTTWLKNKYINENGMLVINNQLISCNKDATTITIPAEVTLINEDAFNGCNKLNEIIIKGTIDKFGDEKYNNELFAHKIKNQVSNECVVNNKDKQIKVADTIDINTPNKYIKMMLGAILLFGGIIFGKKQTR